jgi:hypothetical protein
MPTTLHLGLDLTTDITEDPTSNEPSSMVRRTGPGREDWTWEGGPGGSRTLDAGRGVSPSEGGDRCGTAKIRGVSSTKQAREAAPQKKLWGKAHGEIGGVRVQT